ncbi:baculoviral IAP repeat-containing protein 7-like isoform X2 [Dysidea avara]
MNSLYYILPVEESPDLSLQYEQLQNRSRTFEENWKGPHSMAEAGFVYTGQEDHVYCFSCNIKLDGWTKNMDPLLRHKEESPTCSFVRQQLQVIKGEKGKVKSVVAPSKPLNPRQTASIGQLQSSTLFSSKPIHTVVTGLDEPRLSYATSRGSELGDDYSKMYLPITVENYKSEEERLKSFGGWPLNESVHPEQLARVGFVYTGEGSLVQCFQCGVRYRNWLKGDIPLSVHQRCNPRCTFLQTLSCKRKKQTSEQRPLPCVKNSQGGFKKASPLSPEPQRKLYPSSWNSNPARLSQEKDHCICTTLGATYRTQQSVYDESSSAVIIMTTLDEGNHPTNILPNGKSFNSQTLMKRCQCSTYCPPPGGSAPRGGIIPPDFSAPQGGIIPPDFSAPDCTDPLEYYSTHPKVDQVVDDLTNFGRCEVCKENKVDFMFQRCGHAACSFCTTLIRQESSPRCPFCRCPILSIVHVYL